MTDQPTRTELKALRRAFLDLRHPDELAEALGVPLLKLTSLGIDPPYRIFEVPKSDGTMRLIEDPEKPLKGILRRLNRYLQAVYYFQKTEAAYGFQLHCANDHEHQYRDILNNARQHLGCQWLLNVDLEDFFHHIKVRRLARIFLSPPFSFPKDLVRLLLMLVTLKGRLPMGSPTSPILSHFAAALLDGELSILARGKDWHYTRFADDMSFSSQQPITVEDVTHVRDYIRAFEFYPNEEKVKLYGPDDVKEVTGLVLADKKVVLKEQFITELEKEIHRLGEVHFVHGKMSRKRSNWVEKYQERISGMLAFAGYVMGEGHGTVQQLQKQFKQASEDAEKDFGSYSWLDFPYM